MKNIKLYRFYFLIFVFAGLILHSCDKSDVPETKVNEYFLSVEHKFNLTVQEIKTINPQFALIAPIINDVEIYKIIYKTTYKDKGIQASGLVCLPKAAGNYPIMSFQNGTNTEQSKAPTENPRDDAFLLLESMASMGFIVVVPDYIGFGASSQLPHPYLHAESTTQSILDMLRAVKEFGNQEKIVAKPTKDLFIFGYSQGGWATMQLQNTIEKTHSAEFNLVASSCAAGPYSIGYMNEFITAKTDYPMPYFLTYLLNAYITTGLVTNPITDFIKSPYASKIAGLYDGKHSGGYINSELTTKMGDLLTNEFRTGFVSDAKFATIKSQFSANSITPWKITTPTRLYHGTGDDYIPLSLSQKMYTDFLAKGVSESTLKLVMVPGNHSEAISMVGLYTILWFLELKK